MYTTVTSVDITQNSTASTAAYNTFPEFVAVGVLTLFISIFGTIGNSMVLLAVAFSRQLRTKTNIFVVSLATSDLMTSTFLIWNVVARFGEDGWLLPNAEWLCGLTAVVVHIGIGASLTNMLAIALDRVVIITRPFSHLSVFTGPKITVMLILAWLHPVSGAIAPLLAGIGSVGFDPLEFTCKATFVRADGTLEVTLYNAVQAATSFLLLIGIAVCYLIIYFHLRRHFKRQREMRMSNIPRVASPNAVSSTVSDDNYPNFNKSAILTSHKISSSVLSEADDPVFNPNPGVNTSSMPRANNSASSPAEEATPTPALVNSTGGERRSDSDGLKRIDQQQLEITKNVFLVVCVYTMCVLAIGVTLILPIPERGLIYAQIPIIANAAVNPIIYIRKHPHFKVTLRLMLKCRYKDIPQPSNILLFFLSRGDMSR